MGRDGRDRLPDDLVTDYHAPPETPREAMWAAIETALSGSADAVGSGAKGPRTAVLEAAAGASRHGHHGGSWRTTRFLSRGAWAVAAALVLTLGIGIGRMTAPEPGRVPGPATPLGAPATASSVGGPVSPDARASAIRTVTRAHLGRIESLLTQVRADAGTGRYDRGVGEWGRSLLRETRLFLDSPSMDDPALRGLLEDLEVILTQVALLSADELDVPARARQELSLIAAGLEAGALLTRIRSVLPEDGGIATL